MGAWFIVYSHLCDFHVGCITSFVSASFVLFDHLYGANFYFIFCVQTELIDPALKGTINVLRSCSKVPSVRRVVVTSSMSAVEQNGKPLTPEVIIDESWFSDAVLCKESKVCIRHYFLSHTISFAWNTKNYTGSSVEVQQI